MRLGTLLAAVVAATLMAPALAAQAPRDSLPNGVTAERIARGRDLFLGAGLCMACHGADAKGAVGPDLTDTLWQHHKGSYEEIYAQLVRGIPAEESKSGTLMPPRGGSSLTDDELRAVAAYVWSLSRRKT
ncbi:MAG: c-type cytochrome [Gemmatimonadales bacterium]